MSGADSPIAERTVLVRGVRLATAVNTVARAALARVPLVVLPAAGHVWADYSPVLGRFAGERRVAALDWPGFGASDVPSPAGERRVAALDWPGFGASDVPSPAGFTYSAAGYADLLDPWLDGLGIGRAVFLGNSVGGAAALRLALAQPARVAGLALVAPAGFTPAGPLRAIATRVLGTPGILARVEPGFTALYLGPANPATREIVARHRAARQSETYRAQVDAYAALWRSFGRPDDKLAAEVHAVRAPAIVMRGELDPIFTAADLRRAATAIGEPGGRGALQVVLPNAGHLPFLQQPEAFNSAVRGLIETTEASHG